MLCKVVSSLSKGASNPGGRMCLACDTEGSRQVSIPNLRQSVLIEWAKVGLERPLSFLIAFYCSACHPTTASAVLESLETGQWGTL